MKQDLRLKQNLTELMYSSIDRTPDNVSLMPSLDTGRHDLVGSPVNKAGLMKQAHDHKFHSLMMKSFPKGELSKHLIRAKIN